MASQIKSLAPATEFRLVDDLLELQKINPTQYELIGKMVQLQLKKGHDYSGAAKDTLHNLRCSEEINIKPWLGALIRASDKWRRICAFACSGEFKVIDESLRDTCLDLANYALFATQLYSEEEK